MDQILKIKLGREVKDYLAITFGLICYALGWAAFLLPYQITTGGVTGIAAIIYYATGIEIQVSYFIINAVFLGFALKILGPKFSLKTIYAIFYADISVMALSNIVERSGWNTTAIIRTRTRIHGLCSRCRLTGIWYRHCFLQ